MSLIKSEEVKFTKGSIDLTINNKVIGKVEIDFKNTVFITNMLEIIKTEFEADPERYKPLWKKLSKLLDYIDGGDGD